MSRPELRRLLPRETAAAWPKVVAAAPDGAYLAGGTALALHLHHRVSRDLDVFVDQRFDTAAVRRHLESVGVFAVTEHTGDTLNGLLDGAKVQFHEALQLHSLDDRLVIDGLGVAGVRDLMADKLKVIGDRGELRDYLDLMAIERAGVHRVEQGLIYYRTRYGVGPDHISLSHVVRGLGYLDDVSDDPGLPVDRAQIESYWRRRQPIIARNLRSFSYSHGTTALDAPSPTPGSAPETPTRSGRCGALTAAGHPCRNPAGACPHHAGR